MAKLISDGDFADFNNLIQVDGFDTFADGMTIIWRRALNPSVMDRYREDGPPSTQDVVLRAIVNYNYMRSWPITNQEESGELQGQSIQVIFSMKDLEIGGYLKTVDGQLHFDYNPDYDRFVVDGIIRKPSGDSGVSQSNVGPLLYEVIMIEQATATGENRT